MSSTDPIAIPPTIPPDNQFSVNTTRIQKILGTLTATSVSVPKDPPADTEFSVLSNGILSNVNDPVDPQDAATLAYVLANAGGAIPGGSQFDVQFNDGGVFGGSNDLTYDDSGPTLTTNSLTNSFVTIGNGTVNNLPTPTQADQAATKGYAESGFTLTRTTNNTVGSVTYSANEVVNGIITRNITGAGSAIIDNLPSAADIITLVGDTIGTTFVFHIYNSSTDFDSIIRIDASSMGTDITLIGSPQNIYPGYQYFALGKVTSATEIDLIVQNNNRVLINENFNYRGQKALALINNLQTGYITEMTDPESELIDVSEFPKGTFSRLLDPSQVIEQKAVLLEECTGTDNNADNTTNNTLQFRNGWASPQFNPGSWDFYISNPATSTESVIFDAAKGAFGNYILDATQNFYSIGPGETIWYFVTWDNTIGPDGTGYLYSLGVADYIPA